MCKTLYCSHPDLSMHGTSFNRHSTVVHKNDSSLYPALMLQTGKKTNLFQNFPRPGGKLPQWNAAVGPDASKRAFDSLQMTQSPEMKLLPGTNHVSDLESSWACRYQSSVTCLFPAQSPMNRSDVMMPFFAQMTFVAKWGPHMIRYYIVNIIQKTIVSKYF